MKNKLINFSGVNLSVNYSREQAEEIKTQLDKLYNELRHITLPKIPISEIENENQKWNKYYMSNLNTTLTGDQLITKGDQLLEEAKDINLEFIRTVNVLSCYEALQSDNVDLMRNVLKSVTNTKWYYGSWALHNKQIDKMSVEELKKYLQEYYNKDLKKNTFITKVITDKLEKENQQKNSSYSGGGRSRKAITIPEEPIQSTVEKVEETAKDAVVTEPTKTTNQKILNSDDNLTKPIESAIPKEETNSAEGTAIPLVSNNNQNNGVIGGTTKAASIGAVTGIASNLGQTGTSTKDLSDSLKDKLNIDDISDKIDGTLNSAISTINKIKSNSPLKLTKVNNMEMQDNSGNNFIPPIAGISSAAVAGIGTKMYISRKDDDEYEESDSFFSKEDQKDIKEKETKEENKSLTKEDLIKAIEYGKR